MVEVFKTNVIDSLHAAMILESIHDTFVVYEANFDLADCDRILRVKSLVGGVDIEKLKGLINHFGFHAEVLPDDCVITSTTLAYSISQ
ncbi:MAG TPA: hypothetical protein VK666_14380 [Chryseolinea sp.]|nr:hypothetical protein [Chryseolinea sp.]